MADFDSSYRMPRRRAGMDSNTRRLALIAGGIGAVLVAMVGAWSLSGKRAAGVPVVEADARPLRVKPEASRGPEIDEPAEPSRTGLAPTPETPAPEVLKAQAAAAAAAAAAAPPARQAAATPPPPAVARPPLPTQPVALTTPVPPAAAPPRPAVAAPPQAVRPPAAAPAAARAVQVQLGALTSRAAAEREWTRLQRRMPDLLARQRPTVAAVEQNGRTFWRLRTGSFADSTQAGGFCAQVRAKGGNCQVAAF